MDETNRKKSWGDYVLELPPYYFYSCLALIGLGVFFWSIWSGDEIAEPPLPSGSEVSTLVDAPTPLAKKRDSLQLMLEALPADALVDFEMSAIFQELQRTIVNSQRDDDLDLPPWVSPEFIGHGIDADSFSRRFSNQRVTVSRWRTSDQAPRFSGRTGFFQFVGNATADRNKSKEFRIELKAYSSESNDDQISVRLVAETYRLFDDRLNDIQLDADEFLMSAKQSTAIWDTRWRRTKLAHQRQPSFELLQIKVLAEERITAKMNSHQLFADCTHSILAGTEAEEQLKYGLDQWARVIPGIDINGNQGLAIGDTNGDGLEDIYLCQPHGLRNRLLTQRADGSVKDVSEESRADILDQSRSALLLDIDNDGDQDLVVATDETLVLLSNDGRGVFQVERKIPVGRNAQSIAAADFDLDGDLDLYLCKFEDINRQTDLLVFPTDFQSPDDGGRNVLLRNDEGYNFVDVTKQIGLASGNHQYSHSAIWYDHDQDGDPDLYVANEFGADQLFENDGGYFSNIASSKGITDIGRHKSASVADFNADGAEDLFVATDVSLAGYRVLKGLATETGRSPRPNSTPDKTIVDNAAASPTSANTPSVTSSQFTQTSVAMNKSSSKGTFESALAERQVVNRQMVTESQVRYNLGEKPFQAYFLRAPIFNNQSAQGSTAVDFNNDGWQDIVVTNGGMTRDSRRDVGELFFAQAFGDTKSFVLGEQGRDGQMLHEYQVSRTAHEIADLCRGGYSLEGRQRNRCYLNIGAEFANISAISGLDFPDDARAISTVDWDQDGDLDIVMTCRSAPQLRILCNQHNARNSSVTFQLQGTKSNRDAIGARVELFVSGFAKPLVRTIHAGSGNLSQSSKRLVFGIPQEATIHKAVVHWPSGLKQTFEGITPGASYDVVEENPSLAEKAIDRFGVRIRTSPMPGRIAIPRQEDRSLFYPRAPMIPVEIQADQGKWRQLTATKQPLLVLFWSRNAESDQWLRRLNEIGPAIERSGLQTMAVLVEDDVTAEDQWRYAKQTMSTLEYKDAWGTLSAGSLDQLKYVFGDWFHYRKMPERPFALLIDTSQRACAYYTSQSFDPDQLLVDVKLIEQSDLQFRYSASQNRGIWVADAREMKTNRLRVRLAEAGYHLAADRLADASNRQRAHELSQKAIELGAEGEYPQARLHFRKAISLDPGCISAYIGEGQLLVKMALEKPQQDAARYELQIIANQRFETALELNPVNVEAIIGRAELAMLQDRREDALEQLKAFLQIDPERYEIHALIGRMLFKQKEYKEAAKYMVRAFDQRPNLPYLAGDLGYLYLVSGEDRIARKFLRLAHRLQPSDRNILRLLAEAEFITGNFDDAVRLFREVTRLDPTQHRAKNVLAWLLATCPYEQHRDGDMAIKIMSPMVDMFGDNSPSTIEIYAACYAEIGDFERAIKLQSKAIKLLDSQGAAEAYSEAQRKGMKSRLELYRRNRPYRTADLLQVPIQRPKRLD